MTTEYEQPQQEDMQLYPNMNQPIFMKQESGLIMWQENLDEFCETLRLTLCGKKVINGEEKQISEALMSEDGANLIIQTVVYPRLNRNIMLSNLSEQDVFRIAKECRKDVITFIRMYYRVYKIDKGSADLIVKFIDHQVYPTLRRALNNGERKHLESTFSENVITRPNQNEEKKKGFFKLFGG